MKMLEKRTICRYPIKYLQDELKDITTGDMIMIAANTGSGKSTISRLFMENAIQENCPVVLYSLEDQQGIPAANECYQEFVGAGNYNIDFKTWLKDNTLHPEKYVEFRKKAMEKANRTNADGLKLRIVHEQGTDKQWTLKDVILEIRKEVAQGYKLFIIDHIDVLVPSERPEDMVNAVRWLWKTVCEYNIALITFSQLASRRSMDSLCPGLDDLRGSKAKIHTPTVVISLARHIYGQYSLFDDPKYKPTYMRILKNRFGNTSCAVVYFYNGRYHDTYTKVECNELGTYIDGKNARQMARQQKATI